MSVHLMQDITSSQLIVGGSSVVGSSVVSVVGSSVVSVVVSAVVSVSSHKHSQVSSSTTELSITIYFPSLNIA